MVKFNILLTFLYVFLLYLCPIKITKNQIIMTPFEQAQEQVKQGTLKTPSVSVGAKAVDYFGYQLLVHIYNLKIMGAGMKFRGITFTQIKKYYGLKGKSAKECVPQLQQIFDEYKTKLGV